MSNRGLFRLSRLPETLFSNLIEILKRTQFPALASLSDMVWEILNRMYNCSAGQCGKFYLEDKENSEILSYPKNSSVLLESLSLSPFVPTIS